MAISNQYAGNAGMITPPVMGAFYGVSGMGVKTNIIALIRMRHAVYEFLAIRP